jgi:geranylgeranyl diphosphate synthase, type I
MTCHTPSFDELRAAVDLELRRFLHDRCAALPGAEVLIEEITRLLDSGGKRIRPAFCYWGYRTSSAGHVAEAVRASASLELLHTFAIVHDDIMDSSEERRGVPTVHVLRGLNVALLVGDLALVLADALFLDAGFPSDRMAGAFEWYSRMRQQVIAGQYLDLELSSEPFVTEERARWVAVLKSGRYSIEQPLAIGACLAGADEARLGRIRSFGAPLGEAFQLRDDLLGTFGDRSSTGKPVDSDIREGKRNVLYAKTVAALSGAERGFFVDRWGAGSNLSVLEVARLRGLVQSSGARAATERLLAELTAGALRALDSLDIAPEVRTALAELAHEATFRQT